MTRIHHVSLLLSMDDLPQQWAPNDLGLHVCVLLQISEWMHTSGQVATLLTSIL